MQKLHDFLESYKTILKYFLTILIIVLVGSVFITVVTRYVFGSPVLWGVEVGRILLVWITFIGAILVTADREHVRMADLVQRFIGAEQFKKWDKVISVFTIIFVSILFYYCLEMMQVVSSQLTHALRIPYVIFYWPMVLFCISNILYLIDDMFSERSGVEQT